MKLNKNIKIFLNYFLGPILFVWLSYSIFRQIKHQPNLQESWHSIKNSFSSPEVINLFIVFVLMLVNWSLEALKWRLSIQQVQLVSFFKAFKAILSGVSFSVTTPNRTGEYLGRVLYMNEGNRLRVISLTILSSVSQLIITILFGLLGLFLIKKQILESGLPEWSVWINTIMLGGMIFFIGILLFYFRLNWLLKWFNKIARLKRYNWLFNELEKIDFKILFKLLFLSGFRYLVFISQYYLLFQLFAVEIDWWQGFWAVAVVFFVMSIIPSIALFDVVQKIFVAKEIIGIFTINTLGIGLVTSSIWFINLVIPATIGSLLILSLKIFTKENEIAKNNNSL